MITDIAVPLEVAAALCATFALIGGWAGRRYTLQRMLAHVSPELWTDRPSHHRPMIGRAAGGSAVPEAPRAVLLGRVAVMDHAAGVCDADTVKRVADVMRASLRRVDRVTIGEGATFTVEIGGGSEGGAARIAQRLRDALARLRFSHSRSNIGVSARFGVAAGPGGIAGDVLIRRAREALNIALREGEEHIVKASDVAEIRLLPPPDPAPIASAA